MVTPAERAAMRQAIAASRAAVGVSNPNPPVGAAVVDPDGNVLAVGVTRAVGAAHAEIVALEAAGAAAHGATLVTTLEPCRHTGRTGPCTEAIVAAGITRVVIALDDPSADAGGGAAALRAAGVDVVTGIESDDALRVLGAWVTATRRQRAHVTWKYAATLDGRTAARDGTSRWITGSEARQDVHRLRLAADAVVVGIGTVLADDPSLTVRGLDAPRQPVRVVLDTHARTPLDAHVVDTSAPTVVVVGRDADTDRARALRATAAEVIEVGVTGSHIDPGQAVAALTARGLRQVLLEGGATVAGAFVAAGLVDRVVGYLAPALLGAGPAVLGDIGVPSIDAARRLRLVDVGRLGADVRIVAEVTEAEVA